MSRGGPLAGIPQGIRALLLANFCSTFAYLGIVTFAGDQVFSITSRELDLGFLGLAAFTPVFLLSPIAGTIVDRFDRRLVYGAAVIIEIAIAISLFLFVRSEPTNVWPIFALIAAFGACRAFAAPASRAMPIDLAPPESLEQVIAVKAFAFQSGVIAGPIVAGFAAAIAPELPYLIGAVLLVAVVLLLTQVPKPPIEQLETPPGALQAFRDALDGLRYIRRNEILLAAISLDLFAVLLGGATALLPALIAERLGGAEIGLGTLRAADGIGAASMSLLIAWRPIKRRIGTVLLGSVAVFGVATIALGLTRSFAVAFAAIFVLSAADAISVYIRSSVVPLATPEIMRGRVIALENVFIGGSNELGALESGVAAQFLGLVGAIVTGGLGTLGVVVLWWRWFPALRRIDRFDDVVPLDSARNKLPKPPPSPA